MDKTVRVMSSCVEESTKGIFHGTGCSGVNVALYRGQMNDIFPMKKGWNLDALRINPVKCSHAGLGSIGLPRDILRKKVIFFWDTIAPIYGL